MGWQAESWGLSVTLDAHGEREREHNRRWCELQWRLESVVMEGKYDTLNPNASYHECELSHDECQETRRTLEKR